KTPDPTLKHRSPNRTRPTMCSSGSPATRRARHSSSSSGPEAFSCRREASAAANTQPARRSATTRGSSSRTAAGSSIPGRCGSGRWDVILPETVQERRRQKQCHLQEPEYQADDGPGAEIEERRHDEGGGEQGEPA